MMLPVIRDDSCHASLVQLACSESSAQFSSGAARALLCPLSHSPDSLDTRVGRNKRFTFFPFSLFINLITLPKTVATTSALLTDRLLSPVGGLRTGLSKTSFSPRRNTMQYLLPPKWKLPQLNHPCRADGLSSQEFAARHLHHADEDDRARRVWGDARLRSNRHGCIRIPKPLPGTGSPCGMFSGC
ncbi:uncharacterized protein B0I36DRAFT_329522 [Microdochium trichocladiopsis]|uniref:Uncharacterized protein n=1 Tax=Microdochium trichocladiopsis TaxID=1682393 RepID=A0A9P8Y1P8_9PEZI|nr:uncharacterized protein B0I36DRAFT_329522 [Microdochium trichocladiopsis]KAH7025949.1 hypothetical protein B0I36DRAFT_329522 [Microdochium trichocladiopsis]